LIQGHPIKPCLNIIQFDGNKSFILTHRNKSYDFPSFRECVEEAQRILLTIK